MLVLKCAGCKKKLWRYDKIGPGEVLRCHKTRITKMYQMISLDRKVQCTCGKTIGIDKGQFVKMIGNAFTYAGTKRHK